MDTIVNVAFPVFAIIGLGYAAGHLRILDPASAEALNKFVYYFALPPVLFVFTAKAPVDVIFNWPFIGVSLAGAIGTLAVSAVVGAYAAGTG